MNLLLHHVDLITRCLRRGDVEAAMIMAIGEILQAAQTRFYKYFAPPGDRLVGLSIEAGAGDAAVRAHDDGFAWPAETGSIEKYPHLLACLDQSGLAIEEMPDGSVRTSLLVETSRHEPYAFIQIDRASPLTPDELDIAQGFIALLRNSLGMLDYSETDSLTRLLNRKTFDEYLMRILAIIPNQDDAAMSSLHLPHRRHACATSNDHWLAVMDIDKFKSINDRFGHLIGDEVLILMADLMRKNFRVQDKLFRFGGEEFVALLRPAEYAHAQAIFERFRRQVEAYAFPQVGHVTVSIGFTRIKFGDTPSVILDSADEALYWAKEHGRNQCHAYETLVAEGKLQGHAAAQADVELF